ncbi:MAG: CAP domain-containing protein [Deltaproteobacteria bacterium]|nr:CAP domain-containing protein [Deltaproteobacteria bacterium]
MCLINSDPGRSASRTWVDLRFRRSHVGNDVNAERRRCLVIGRRYASLLLSLFLLVPSATPTAAQSLEEDEGEVVRVPPKWHSREKRPNLSEVGELIVRGTNDFRQEEGRQPVRSDAGLKQTARYFAGYMARNDRYGHRADGLRPSDRAKKHGYAFCIVSENIAYQFSTAGFTAGALAEDFVVGWKNSPGHRANMLDPEVTQTGVAVAQSPRTGYYYAVQMFGRPASLRVRFRVTNRSGSAVEYELGDRLLQIGPYHYRIHRTCRARELVFRSPDGSRLWPEAPAEAVTPRDGDRYTVVRQTSGKLTVRREPARRSS